MPVLCSNDYDFILYYSYGLFRIEVNISYDDFVLLCDNLSKEFKIFQWELVDEPNFYIDFYFINYHGDKEHFARAFLK